MSVAVSVPILVLLLAAGVYLYVKHRAGSAA